MIDFSLAFKVVNERNCPFYGIDDWFILTGQSVRMPPGRPSCLVLVRELTNFLFSRVAGADGDSGALRGEIVNCGGCTGLIKFQVDEPSDSTEAPDEQGGNRGESKDCSTAEAVKPGKKSRAAVSGVLEEISPTELLQFFHMHQKTGKLLLNAPEGTGRVAFREGEIIGARFEEQENKEAVFAMLALKSGRFSFLAGIPDALMEVESIGDFMMVLMEGIKRLDEGEGP